jgi:hypothetical protein
MIAEGYPIKRVQEKLENGRRRSSLQHRNELHSILNVQCYMVLEKLWHIRNLTEWRVASSKGKKQELLFTSSGKPIAVAKANSM